MLGHEPFQATELVSREPARRSQGYQFQPELRNGTGLLMCMWGGSAPSLL